MKSTFASTISLVLLMHAIGFSALAQPDHSQVLSEYDRSSDPQHADDLNKFNSMKFRFVGANGHGPIYCAGDTLNGGRLVEVKYEVRPYQTSGWFSSERFYNSLKFDGSEVFANIDQGANHYVRYDVENPNLADIIGCPLVFGSDYCKTIQKTKPVPAYNPSYTIKVETTSALDNKGNLQISYVSTDTAKPSADVSIVKGNYRYLDFDGTTLVLTTMKQEKSAIVDPKVVQQCVYQRVE